MTHITDAEAAEVAWAGSDEGEAADLTAWLRFTVAADLQGWHALEKAHAPDVERLGDAVWTQARERVADGEAKLAILGEHGGEHMCSANGRDGNTWSWYRGDCRVMLMLASGYRFRPGYREEEWAP